MSLSCRCNIKRRGISHNWRERAYHYSIGWLWVSTSTGNNQQSGRTEKVRGDQTVRNYDQVVRSKGIRVGARYTSLQSRCKCRHYCRYSPTLTLPVPAYWTLIILVNRCVRGDQTGGLMLLAVIIIFEDGIIIAAVLIIDVNRIS